MEAESGGTQPQTQGCWQPAATEAGRDKSGGPPRASAGTMASRKHLDFRLLAPRTVSYIYIHTHTYTHTHTYIHRYTYIYVYVCICKPTSWWQVAWQPQETDVWDLLASLLQPHSSSLTSNCQNEELRTQYSRLSPGQHQTRDQP